MDDSRTVFCGNLSDKVTEELLFELFLQAAPLERVRIPTDKEGRKSNFAFITFRHQESVDYVLQLLNGIKIFDKNLIVKPRNGNFANRSLDRNDYIQPRVGSAFQQHRPQNRDWDNHGSRRDYNRDHNRDTNRDNSPRNFKDWDNSYNRHDRERHGFERQDSNRRHDRRGGFNDRGQRNRNRFY